jgi:hypothetical protein
VGSHCSPLRSLFLLLTASCLEANQQFRQE